MLRIFAVDIAGRAVRVCSPHACLQWSDVECVCQGSGEKQVDN